MSLTFAAKTSSLTGQSFAIAYSAPLGCLVAVGVASGGCSQIASSFDGGLTWNDGGCPLGAGQSGAAVAWSTALGLFVVVATGSSAKVATSPDGLTWTTHTVAMGVFVSAVAWSDAQAKFVATGCVDGSSHAIWTSPDATTWTGQTTPVDFGCGKAIDYSPTLGLWVIGDDCGQIWTSPTATAWTQRANPFDDTFCDGLIDGVRWLPGHAMFVANGTDDPGAGTVAVAKSTNGTTWVALSTPFDGGVGRSTSAAENGSLLYLTGRKGTTRFAESSDGGSTWSTDATPFSAFSLDVAVVPARAVVIVGNANPTTAAASLLPPPVTSRFFEGYPWRFIFTDIRAPSATPPTPGSVTTTWAHGILTNRQISKTLNQSTTIVGAVWPDDQRANEIWSDGFPVISQNNRLVYCFRREGGSPPWKCRAAGVLMSPEDDGDADTPLTHFTAYDPWTALAGRLAVDAFGDPAQSAYGFSYTGNAGSDIALQLLKNTILTHGPVFIDAGPSWGGTSSWAGVIETTDALVFNVQQGATVADVWNELVDTGTMDIVLTPVYDPNGRPGITHDLSIFKLAGNDLPAVVFGWDKMNRALTTADRMHSGTPGDFVNKIIYYPGQGGLAAPPQSNTASIDTFGEYQTTQFFPETTMPTGQTPTLLAKQALRMGKQGKRTFTVNPTPERAPVPLRDYDVGDRVGIWTTKRLRVATSASFALFPPNAQRVQTIPIVIDDDGIERIQAMVTSPDWRDPEEPPAPPMLRAATGRTSAAVLAAGIRSTRRRGIYRTTAGTRLQTFYGHLSGYGYGT